MMIIINNNNDMLILFFLQRGQRVRQQSTATGSSVTQTLEQGLQKKSAYAPASINAQDLKI